VSRRLFVQRLAEDDLAEQAGYIVGDSVDAALRFLTAAEESFTRLAAFPEIGRRRKFHHPDLTGVRSWPVPGFEKHLIFYRLTERGVEILRVLHSARDLDSILGHEDR
jgi:toxin ParE1/3/4